MIRNFTPHKVTIYDAICKNITHEFPSEGTARVRERVSATVEDIPVNEGVPVVKKSYAEITGLPEGQSGTIYIVSLLVLQASNRDDLVCPDNGIDSVVRDIDGEIIGVRRFQIKSK